MTAPRKGNGKTPATPSHSLSGPLTQPSEADFQRAVLDLARILGWRVAHFRPARTAKGWRTAVAADGKGFPDLVLVKDRVLYRELKAAGGKLTPEQRAWGDALLKAGQDWKVWTPDDWPMITKELMQRG